MSTNDYNRLYNNIYTKSEVDTIVQSNSGGIRFDDTIYLPLILGSNVTPQQSANIANGSFANLPIGSYWTISNINYRIMARDQFYGYNGINTHHVVVMPDTIYSLQRYDTIGYNNGAYYGSNVIRPYIENTYNSMITNAFGENHILTHTHDLTNGTYNNGYTLWFTPTDTKAWLINSYNVDGYKYGYESNYNWQTADKVQFPVFKLYSDLKIANYNGSASAWWLGTTNIRTESNARNYCYVYTDGKVSDRYYEGGVRPAFLVY